MKRVLYFAVAAALALTAVFTVSAAPIQAGEDTLTGYGAAYVLRPGQSIQVKLNPSLTLGWSPAWEEDQHNLALQINTQAGLEGLLSFSPGEGSWFGGQALRADSWVTITVLSAHPSGEQAGGMVSISAYHKSDSTQAAQASAFWLTVLPEEAEKERPDDTGPSDGNSRPEPPGQPEPGGENENSPAHPEVQDGSEAEGHAEDPGFERPAADPLAEIQGFAAAEQETGLAMVPGLPAVIPLEDGWFSYIGEGRQAITWETAQEYGLQASAASSGEFSARLVQSGSRPAVELTASSLPAGEGVHEAVIQLAGTQGPLADSEMELAVQVFYSNSPASLIAGFTNNGSAPVLHDQSERALVFAVNDDNFTFSGSGSDVAQTLAFLNRNTSWIQLSTGLDSLVRKEFVHLGTSGAEYGVLLTARTSGTIPAGATIRIGDNGAAHIFSQAILFSPLATDGGRITGITSGAWLGSRVTKNGSVMLMETVDSLDIRPGDQLELRFDSDFFTWSDSQPTPAGGVPRNALTAGNIKVRLIGKRYANVIDKVELVNAADGVYVRVQFVEYFASTKEREFEAAVSFYHNGSRHQASEVVLSGTMQNEEIEVYNSDDYLDISDGTVVHAMESVGSIDLDLGEGVTVKAKLTKDKKYYGYAQQDPNNYDYQIMEDNPSIERVYHIKTGGLDRTVNRVTFDLDSRYYVYSSDGEFLGTTLQKLPFHSTYYLSTKEVDLDLGGGDGETIIYSGSDTARSGQSRQPGGATAPGGSGMGSGGVDSSHDNPPNGGVPGEHWMASMIGLLCLAVGALLLRKRD